MPGKYKKAMEQNDPKTFVGTEMETTVKGQEGQKPDSSKATGKKEGTRLGRSGSSSKLTESAPITKDTRGE